MAKTKMAQQNRLTPSPKALQKALEKSADQARKLAAAFGVTVPYAKPKAASRIRTAGCGGLPTSLICYVFSSYWGILHGG